LSNSLFYVKIIKKSKKVKKSSFKRLTMVVKIVKIILLRALGVLCPFEQILLLGQASTFNLLSLKLR
jgi:hypothetical protein